MEIYVYLQSLHTQLRELLRQRLILRFLGVVLMRYTNFNVNYAQSQGSRTHVGHQPYKSLMYQATKTTYACTIKGQLTLACLITLDAVAEPHLRHTQSHLSHPPPPSRYLHLVQSKQNNRDVFAFAIRLP